MQAKYLSQIGGLTVEDCVRRILQSVMTAELARQYSFFGRRNKLPFNGLQLKSVVYGMLSMYFMPFTKCLQYYSSANWLKNVLH